MSMSTSVRDGWYLLHPEGCAWLAVQMRSGKAVDVIEEYTAPTHIIAGDRLAGVAQQAVDGRVVADCDEWEACQVSAADRLLGCDQEPGGATDPQLVSVVRLVE